MRERQRQRERDTHTQTEIARARERERRRDRERGKERQRETHADTDREKKSETQTDRVLTYACAYRVEQMAVLITVFAYVLPEKMCLNGIERKKNVKRIPVGPVHETHFRTTEIARAYKASPHQRWLLG